MAEPDSGLPRAAQWLSLLVGSLLLFGVLQLAHLPAALLLACMLVGIAASLRGFAVRVPQSFLYPAQGLIGCLMAQSLQPELLLRVLHDWPLFLGFTFLVMAASMGLGWWLSHHKVLPGTTAIWGLAPGAASAMVLMSEAYGADPRLVAFMQYTRVIIVTAVAALVARLWLGPGSSAGLDVDVWALNDYYNVACTLGLVLLGMLSTRLTRAPAGAMLLPLVLGVFLQSQGVLQIELPPLLLMCAYACIGWTIGLRYTRATLVHARRALPRVLVSIAVLIVFGMSLAAALALLGGFDPLTAYLATSPGGADSVAIIATHSLAVDVGFVMAMQVARFILVLLAGPRISRWVAQRAQARHG
jgi:membrane AbrB-like protein